VKREGFEGCRRKKSRTPFCLGWKTRGRVERYDKERRGQQSTNQEKGGHIFRWKEKGEGYGRYAAGKQSPLTLESGRFRR